MRRIEDMTPEEQAEKAVRLVLGNCAMDGDLFDEKFKQQLLKKALELILASKPS